MIDITTQDLFEKKNAVSHTGFVAESFQPKGARMLNVITTTELKFKIEGVQHFIPEGTELIIDKSDNHIVQYENLGIRVTIFEDEYMVIQ